MPKLYRYGMVGGCAAPCRLLLSPPCPRSRSCSLLVGVSARASVQRLVVAEYAKRPEQRMVCGAQLRVMVAKCRDMVRYGDREVALHVVIQKGKVPPLCKATDMGQFSRVAGAASISRKAIARAFPRTAQVLLSSAAGNASDCTHERSERAPSCGR